MVTQVPKWAARYLKPERIQLISDAVAQAESKTSAEIVPMVVRRSSTVGHVPILFLCILIILFFLFDGPTHQAHFLGEHWVWYLADFLLFFTFASFSGRCPFVQRMLTSGADREWQVDQRAEVEFYESEIHTTQGATGVLLYISLMEHRAVVLADKSIAEKFPPQTWSEICDIMIRGIKKQHIGIAFKDAVEKCGEILEPVFPIQPDDVNELKDHLVIKE